jgi:hypothetical protein
MRLTRPRFTIGSLLILVAISAVVLWLLEPKINPPRARIAILGGPKVDRGTVPVDVYRRHWWIIRNDGRLPLILVVTGSTTQTGLSLWSGENLVIPPGGQAEIKLTFGSGSLHRRSGIARRSEFESSSAREAVTRKSSPLLPSQPVDDLSPVSSSSRLSVRVIILKGRFDRSRESPHRFWRKFVQ